MRPVSVGNPFYGSDHADEDEPPRELLFLVPQCKRCGHGICPCCGDWCDTCLDEDEPGANPICADLHECDFDGEVEEVGPIYGMDLPEEDGSQ